MEPVSTPRAMFGWLWELRLTRRQIASLAVGFLAMIGTVVAAFWLADVFKVDSDSVFAIGLGLFIIGLVLVRPWWLQNWADALLQSFLSDSLRRVYRSAGVVLGLVIGAAIVVSGVVRLDLWGRDFDTCRSLYLAARDSHERVRALQTVPRSRMATFLQVPVRYEPASCARYRAIRPF